MLKNNPESPEIGYSNIIVAITLDEKNKVVPYVSKRTLSSDWWSPTDSFEHPEEDISFTEYLNKVKGESWKTDNELFKVTTVVFYNLSQHSPENSQALFKLATSYPSNETYLAGIVSDQKNLIDKVILEKSFPEFTVVYVSFPLLDQASIKNFIQNSLTSDQHTMQQNNQTKINDYFTTRAILNEITNLKTEIDNLKTETETLKDHGHKKAAAAANSLATTLESKIDTYLKKPNDDTYSDLKNTAPEIDKTQKALAKHLAAKKIVANIGFGILTLGTLHVGKAIHKAITAIINKKRKNLNAPETSFLFFNKKSEAEKKVDEISRKIKHLPHKKNH